MRRAVDIALRRKGMIVATTDDDAANAIESVPGAFGERRCPSSFPRSARSAYWPWMVSCRA